MKNSTVRGEVYRTKLPRGGRQEIVAIYHTEEDGFAGELARFEVYYKANMEADTKYKELSVEEARTIFESFDIRPEDTLLHLSVDDGKVIKDPQCYTARIAKGTTIQT